MRDLTHWTHPRAACRGTDSSCCPVAWLPWIVVLLLMCVPLAVFWLVPSHEFVLWDDNGGTRFVLRPRLPPHVFRRGASQ